eukprot:TRINITY_DN83251_c0_g1_i5.p1 TRINITY_DN83251_c0_g1~~TRINITY_DN83251_c0_g1_i5.p1  ORF type:complete len:516 (-),score=48.34 TRINITY_DN83251_c0_g1_i5:305-1795(-)
MFYYALAIGVLLLWLIYLLFGLVASIVGLALAVVGLFGALMVLRLLVLPKFFNRPKRGTVGFFHPNADGGGGGERVLWCAIEAVTKSNPHCQIVIYCHTGCTSSGLAADAISRFGIKIPLNIRIVTLDNCESLYPQNHPRFTLLGQSYASYLLGWQAMRKLVPEVLIDTSGWAFIYPLARLLGCKLCCYVHYPTVSTDMLERVWSRESAFNNNSNISRDPWKSVGKWIYYKIFAFFYGMMGAFADVVMVNSSWTAAHVRQIWWRWREPAIVYPPCDTQRLLQIPLDRPLKHFYIISVAQFRPEKNHALQLEAYARARQQAGMNEVGYAVASSRFKIIGSCRNEEDSGRVEQLKQYARQLGIDQYVDFCVNIPYSDLVTYLSGAVAGVHTMKDEHFGISVVEYMAAGLVPIAHDSAGPQMDIITTTLGELELMPQSRVGYLCENVEDFSMAIMEVLAMDQRTRLGITHRARERSKQFSQERFLRDFTESMASMLSRV